MITIGSSVSLMTFLNLPSSVKRFPVKAYGKVLEVSGDRACVKYSTQQGTMSNWMPISKLTLEE